MCAPGSQIVHTGCTLNFEHCLRSNARIQFKILDPGYAGGGGGVGCQFYKSKGNVTISNWGNVLVPCVLNDVSHVTKVMLPYGC